MLNKATILMLLVAVLGPNAQLSGGKVVPIRIIVNDANTVDELTRAQLSRLFLKKVTTWDDGRPLEPVDLGEGATARETFTAEVLGKRVAAVKAYWQQMIFSGRAVPPPEKKSEDEVVLYVSSRAGAIGYISAETAIRPGVKTVRVLD